jgi:diguanylate cyclase (GGDEF)-like protein
MQNRKIRSIVLLAILLITGFLFTSFFSYFTAHQSISTEVAKTTLPLSSDNIYSEIQRDLLRPIFISSMMAKDTFVRDWVLRGEINEEAIIKYLKEIQTQYSTVTSFFVSDKTRKYYHSTGVLETVDPDDKQDVWYFRVQKMEQDYEVNVDTDTANPSALTVFINHRVYDYSGNYIGAIGVGLALNTVKKLIEHYNTRYGREVYFFNKIGEPMLRGRTSELLDYIDDTSVFSKKILSSLDSSIVYEKEGKDIFINSRYVPEFGWYLVVAQVGNEAEKRLQNILLLNLGVSFIISLIIIVLVHFIIASYQRKLEKMATTDKLTGSANRHMFEVLFNHAQAQSKRANSTLSAILFDLDYFKKINDTYGHPAGDAVLKTLIETIQTTIRESDLIFRWGGEEFLIILPETDLSTAYEVAEKIRETTANLVINYEGQSISISISIGVACMSEQGSSHTLIEHADNALYRAKKKGRNSTECHQ